MRMILAAGGTAGHVNPALSIADGMKRLFPDCEILFVGALGGMEERLVKKAGYNFKAYRMSGIQRHVSFQNVKRNIEAARNYIETRHDVRKLLREFKPDVAVGTGGYCCAPILMEAAHMGIKTAVHESNSLPGIAIKLLSHKVDKVLVSNEDVLTHLHHTENCVVTGNPLRSNIPIEERSSAREKLGLPEGMTIVSFGGSLGANKISEAVAALVKWEQHIGGINHIHSYGGNGKDVFEGLMKQNGIAPNERFRPREYIDNMYTCMSAADLIISRAGAMTLTEIKAAGRASILVPFPKAAENHQYYNALTLQKNGAAVLIEDKDLTPELLTETVKELYSDRARLDEMGENAKKMHVANATDLVLSNILDLIK